MAHELNINADGSASMAYFGDKPWHGLGLQVPGLMTTREALVAGRLDWHVDLKELHIKGDLGVNEDGSVTQIPDLLVPETFATVRRDTNTVLGVVGPGYCVVQNIEAFEFFDSALGDGSAAIETVGALGKGERIFAMAKLPQVTEIVPGDPVESYMLLTSSHDGSKAIQALFTPVRVVCNNTLTAALKGAKNVVSIKHTKNVKKGLDKAHELLVQNAEYWTKAQAALKFMAAQDMSKADVTTFLKNLFPGKKLLAEIEDAAPEEDTATRTKNMRDRIETLYAGQAIGSDLAGRTRWGMLNAVTHFIDHEREGRTRKDGSAVSKWENSVVGLGSDLRQKAYDLLLVGAV